MSITTLTEVGDEEQAEAELNAAAAQFGVNSSEWGILEAAIAAWAEATSAGEVATKKALSDEVQAGCAESYGPSGFPEGIGEAPAAPGLENPSETPRDSAKTDPLAVRKAMAEREGTNVIGLQGQAEGEASLVSICLFRVSAGVDVVFNHATDVQLENLGDGTQAIGNGTHQIDQIFNGVTQLFGSRFQPDKSPKEQAAAIADEIASRCDDLGETGG